MVQLCNVVYLYRCGTGLPFGQANGFTTAAEKSTSPLFKLFRVKRNTGVTFLCDFLVCTKNCDGVSNSRISLA
jgi:hypothetical protein